MGSGGGGRRARSGRGLDVASVTLGWTWWRDDDQRVGGRREGVADGRKTKQRGCGVSGKGTRRGGRRGAGARSQPGGCGPLGPHSVHSQRSDWGGGVCDLREEGWRGAKRASVAAGAGAGGVERPQKKHACELGHSVGLSHVAMPAGQAAIPGAPAGPCPAHYGQRAGRFPPPGASSKASRACRRPRAP